MNPFTFNYWKSLACGLCVSNGTKEIMLDHYKAGPVLLGLAVMIALETILAEIGRRRP